MLVTGHFTRVHACYTVVYVLAGRLVTALIFHAVDKVGFVEQRTAHLDEIETLVIKHGVGIGARAYAAHIDER